jgi:hypothetical protein
MTIVRFFVTGVVIDGLLTTGEASPAGYDMTLSPVTAGGEGVSRIEHGRARQTGGRERRPHTRLLREQGSQE